MLVTAEWGVATFSGPTMGTRYNVRCVTSSSTPDSEGLQNAIDQRLADINQMMSTYIADSELSRFNQYTGAGWFTVSAETAKVVAFALETAEATGGALDPTVGPVVNLWGFGPEGRRDKPPTEAEIEAARSRIGYAKLQVRTDPPALKKTQPDVYVDLSAVAKGYAVDAIGNLLVEHGFTSYMVEIGGEVVTAGTKPAGVPWQIGIEKPDSDGRSVRTILESKNEAIATSGDYRNFFERDGQRYSHTIDPATGRPVRHDLATVTVRADHCMRADSLATALLVLGPERGYDWAEQHGVAAMFLRRSDDGVAERTTTGWNAAADRASRETSRTAP